MNDLGLLKGGDLHALLIAPPSVDVQRVAAAFASIHFLHHGIE